MSSTWRASALRLEVTALETNGDCITLSILTITLAFWFFAVSEWVVPTPTAERVRGLGTTFNASSAVAANLIVESFTLTAYTVSGSLSVEPTPGIVAVTIPIFAVVPDAAGV